MPLRLRTILVPIDFSEHAQEALAYARALASDYGAELDLLHVVEAPTFPAIYDLGAEALYGKVPDLARSALEAMARRARGMAPGDTIHVLEGRAADEIVRFAAERNADLIVIASHGLTGLKRLVMGSVAEEVVREARCPVFVVKSFGRSLLEADEDAAAP